MSASRSDASAADDEGEALESFYQLYNALAFDVRTTLLPAE
jgi:hypothetical protein